MHPLRTYDYLCRARLRLFDKVRTLDAEQYAREFPMGRATLGRTLTHIMASEWYYIQRMRGDHVPPYEEWPIREENAPPFAALEVAWEGQAAQTRATLRDGRDWDADIEYRVIDDDGRPQIVTATAADIFTQLVLHEVHHRAQAINMLRHLGITMEDVDYNAIMYTRRPASP